MRAAGRANYALLIVLLPAHANISPEATTFYSCVLETMRMVVNQKISRRQLFFDKKNELSRSCGELLL
jgi:hypothetical protein